MSIKKFLNLGGKSRSKTLMESKVLSLTESEEVAVICGGIWTLLTKTDYLHRGVYDVVVLGLSHEEAAEKSNTSLGYLRNLVGLEYKRLVSDLTVDPLLLATEKDYLSPPQRASVKDIVIELLNWSHPLDTVDEVFQRFTIPLADIKLNSFVDGLTDEQLLDDVNRLAPLVRKRAEALKESRVHNLGYYLYLVMTDDMMLTDIDRARKQLIRDIWWM